MIPVEVSEPLEEGGQSCGECGEPLEFSDLLGTHTVSFFAVKGYICPVCGRKYIFPSYQKPRNKHAKGPKLEPFDWTRIAAPARISRNAGGVNPNNHQVAMFA